jgi:hypothetical protein
MEHISFWSMLTKLIYWAKTNGLKKHTESLLEASREDGIEGNAERTKYVLCLAIKMQDKVIIYREVLRRC